jgi:hypothetical protein
MDRQLTPAEAVGAALMIVGWLGTRPHNPAALPPLRVWDARFEDDDLVVELSDHSCWTLTLTERRAGA